MRWSETLIPTLKEDPTDAVARSHGLMVRAGLIRPVGSGCYAYLPLGLRVLRKVTAVVREEMDRTGAVEVLMPVLWPEQLMEATGRVQAFADDLVRFVDRHGRPHVLAPTHEEVATGLVRDAVKSYRQLPLILYQVQTKFRDEARPRFGVMRTREFLMKDAYSFSPDAAGLDECYEAMTEAYRRTLDRCGLDCVVVEAEPGPMGGCESHEFMVPAATGTGMFARCGACGYAASLARAETAPRTSSGTAAQPAKLCEVETPGRTTIEQVEEFLGVGRERMVKTLIYVADGRPVAALVRGDHETNEGKLRRALEAQSIALADPETIERVTGAPVGFAGPVGLRGVPLAVDHAVAEVRDAVTGANKRDAHLVGVAPGRDFPIGRTVDIRFILDGDPCPRCGRPVSLREGIEVAHVFKLGTRYSEALGASYADAAGRVRPCVMGCYGLGINRLAAAVVETLSDGEGIVWPPQIAPCEAVVMPLDMSEQRIAGASEDAYARLRGGGVDVLLDDRPDRPGVKFHDADLIGFPVRVVVGKGYLKAGTLEVQVRRDGSRSDAPPDGVVRCVQERLAALARPAVE